MLDINYVREHPKVVRENLKRRNEPELLRLLDELLKKDGEWRKQKGKIDELRAERNRVSQEINKAKKAGRDAAKLIKKASDIPKRIEKEEEKLGKLKERVNGVLLRIPNVMHESVPEGKNDEDNVVVKRVGKLPKFSFKPKSHVDLLERNGWVDTERAAKIAGSRWYFLKGDLAVLEMALSMYAVDFMRRKGFLPIVPPFMMSGRAYEGVTSLDDFEGVMYKVACEDLYAIATSEHPLVAMFGDEVLDVSQLPIKYVGFSTNFRKEAGTHGKDEKGIFRVHQFNKVEQIVVCRPAESWDVHEQVIANAAEFFESLGLHFRVVNVCTGDLGIVAAKKYDIEAWFPVQSAYREVVSGSNCTSYQAVRSNIRYQNGKERDYVHTLNCTCVATARTLAAIVENFQRKDGSVEVPKVLQKYCGLKVIGGKNG